MKKVVHICISGILALMILNVFSLLQDNIPFARIQTDKITNNGYEPNSIWIAMGEGCGFGIRDEYGYNNAYDRNMDNPDVIIMGSSHMEAREVVENKNCVYLLNDKLFTDSIAENDLQCFNLGVQGHNFMVQSSNLNYVLERFTDAKLVVMEIYDLRFTEEQLERMLDNGYHEDMKERNFLYRTVQKIPFVRTIWRKYAGIFDVQETDDIVEKESEKNQTTISKSNDDEYIYNLNKVINQIATSAKKNECRLMIFYHNKFDVLEDGTLVRTDDNMYYNAFKNVCEENEVIFVDVIDSFMSHYDKTYEMPYGFSNTTPNVGHLNEIGHQIISEELYKKINELLEVDNGI